MALATLGLAVLAIDWAVWGDDDAGVPQVVIGAARLARAALCWSAVCALVGFALVHLDRDGPARRCLTAAVFLFCIAHQTIIVPRPGGCGRWRSARWRSSWRWSP